VTSQASQQQALFSGKLVDKLSDVLNLQIEGVQQWLIHLFCIGMKYVESCLKN